MIKVLQPAMGHEVDNNERRTGRRTDAEPCLLRRTETGEQVGGAAGRTRGVPRTARASTKPAQVRDGAEAETGTEREAPNRFGSTSSSLPEIHFFFADLLLL